MFKRMLLAAAAVVMLAGPAFASSCPKEMKAIDEALAKDMKKATDEVKKLRAEGEKLHKEGKHAESMAALGKAKGLIGIK
jgi:hypothetical protein